MVHGSYFRWIILPTPGFQLCLHTKQRLQTCLFSSPAPLPPPRSSDSRFVSGQRWNDHIFLSTILIDDLLFVSVPGPVMFS